MAGRCLERLTASQTSKVSGANNSVTPLERPDAWAGKTTLTNEDLAELKAAAAEVTASGLDAQFGDQLVQAALAGISDADSYDTTGNYNQFWLADRTFESQSDVARHRTRRREDSAEDSGRRARRARSATANHRADGRLVGGTGR